jgi:hypothetical protein
MTARQTSSSGRVVSRLKSSAISSERAVISKEAISLLISAVSSDLNPARSTLCCIGLGVFIGGLATFHGRYCSHWHCEVEIGFKGPFPYIHCRCFEQKK